MASKSSVGGMSFILLATDFGGLPGPFLRLVSVFATMRASLIFLLMRSALFMLGLTPSTPRFCLKPQAVGTFSTRNRH
jgi:hypothetical protein